MTRILAIDTSMGRPGIAVIDVKKGERDGLDASETYA